MNASSPRIFYLVPLSRDAGLTSVALGLVRALRLAGVSAGFAKPVAQPEQAGDHDLSCHFARLLCAAAPNTPLAFDHAAEMVRAGRIAALMEEVVALVEEVRGRHDAIVVEGLIPDADTQIATRLNLELIRALGADLIVAHSGAGLSAAQLAEKTATAVEQYGDDGRRPVVGAIVNRCDPARRALPPTLADIPVLAAIPNDPSLSSPRVIDIARALDLEVLREGEIGSRRVQKQVVAARSPEKLLAHLRPGTLVVTPGDRSDAIITAAFVALRGMPLAGFLFTCGGRPAPEIAALLALPPLDRLPLLSAQDDTFTVAGRLSSLANHIDADDSERMERVIAYIAAKIDTRPLRPRLAAPFETLMPPPVFRHRLVEAARAVGARIVLPEGDEPRTLKAAAICAEKGIARCVLLGAPEKIRAVAEAHGVELPDTLELVDPEKARRDYVAPMVELRKSKGLTTLQAEKALEDTVVLGTMMLAQDHVDGLVSGAVHTTANTVRPAMQLIKTAPDSSLVSSVFFMLMPDQVLVYGDCAINPEPSAQDLAEIAIQSADSARAFGIEPRVAMISYSTGSSGAGENVEKVRRATALVRARRRDIVVDGPIQYDAASVESVGRQKAPGGPLDGHANVFVFPDLNTGNTTYKAVQRSANVVSVGPMLQGLRKPVNDLSRGALVEDIVYTIALTAIQAGARARAQAAEAAE